MPFDLILGEKILKDTISKKIKHRDYDRVTQLADEYTKFVTGVDIQSLLRQFTPRENDPAFEQRKRISQAVTPDMANRIMTPMYKIGRSHVDYSLTWSGSKTGIENAKKLNEILDKFYGDQSLDDYLADRMVDLDSTDPNGFIIVEFAEEVNPNDVNSKAKPYPFEVNSKEAVNYFYKNNELQFLVVKLEFCEVDDKDVEIKMAKYSQYLENHIIIATQVQTKNLQDFILSYKLANKGASPIIWKANEASETSEVYHIEFVEHKGGRIPAKRIGTRRDISTRNRTCVPMMHSAYSYFMKSIKSVSEFDLTNCLHVFQQKIQYSEPCIGDRVAKKICSGGKQPDGTDCSVCSGTGFLEHTSSADVIRVKLPKDLKEMVSLENFIAYKGPKMDLLEFMKKFGFYELNELAFRAAYTSDIYVTDTIAKTATEKEFDVDSIYDALKIFATNWSAMRKHITHVVATYRDLGKDLVVVHQFPKDFKMKTVSMLLKELQMANTSGAPSYIKDSINKDLASKIYVDNPNKLIQIETKHRYFPFNGKTESEINNVITNDLCTEYNKILWANFDFIFAKLEEESAIKEINFYAIERKAQKALVDAAVLDLKNQIDLEKAATRATSFQMLPADAGDDELNPYINE